MKVLIIALSGVGDALMFTPAAAVVRRHHPDAVIDALVMFKGAREIYERTGLFNTVHFHDFLNASPLSSLQYVLKLRGTYDTSISVYPSNRREYSLIQLLVGAKKRGGIRYLRRDTENLGFLNNVRITEDDSVHNVQENIRLVEKVFGIASGEEPDLQFPISMQEEQQAQSFLAQAGVNLGDVVIGFHAGTATFKNQAKRRWEPEKFTQLGKRLINDHAAWIVIFGGPEERDLKNKIGSLIGSKKVLIPETKGLTETAALIKQTSAFVTNDSGLMHVAAAMKRKIVPILGPTNERYIYPWHTTYSAASLHLECSPCFYYSPKPLTCSRTDVQFKCIKELDVDIIYKTLLQFII